MSPFDVFKIMRMSDTEASFFSGCSCFGLGYLGLSTKSKDKERGKQEDGVERGFHGVDLFDCKGSRGTTSAPGHPMKLFDCAQEVIILLCNDDGIEAEGLGALRRAAIRSFPGPRFLRWLLAGPMSMVGHRVTTHEPLAVERHGEWNWAVQGTPADCIRVALAHLLDAKPDWVLSGINHGGNLGQDIYISGTVAAAREAAYHGIPAAFSHSSEAGFGFVLEPGGGLGPIRAFGARLRRLRAGRALERQSSAPGSDRRNPGCDRLPPGDGAASGFISRRTRRVALRRSLFRSPSGFRFGCRYLFWRKHQPEQIADLNRSADGFISYRPQLRPRCHAGLWSGLPLARRAGGSLFWMRGGSDAHPSPSGDRILVEPEDGLESARGYLRLDQDHQVVIDSFPGEDPVLAAAVAYCPGLRIIRQPHWECLATFLTSSLKQVAHIRQISLRMRQELGVPRELGAIRAGVFPTPAAVAEAGESRLRELGLGYRAGYVHRAALRLASGGGAPGGR